MYVILSPWEVHGKQKLRSVFHTAVVEIPSRLAVPEPLKLNIV